MSTITALAKPVPVLATPTRQRHRRPSYGSGRAKNWHDNDSYSGEDRGDDGDADSMTSAESDDSVATPEQSPPHHRHAILYGEEGHHAPFAGAFDAQGNWVRSSHWVKEREQETTLSEEGIAERCPDKKGEVSMIPTLNRHDRTKMAMTGSIGSSPCHRSTLSRCDDSSHELSDEDEDDHFDVVGFTSYPTGAVPANRISEGHSVVVPVRLRFEDDSSSDESAGSAITNSSSGSSDSEARRRASVNMLQRLGKHVAIPQRFASARRLGHGQDAPRRPPSLNQISDRVVAGTTSARCTSPGTAVPCQRSVSCPSPIPVQRELFGEVEVMVTPPTPKMPAEKIPGVVLKSPHTPRRAISIDAFGQLMAPAFDVAPGRQLIMEEKERQAKEWLELFRKRQQESHRLYLRFGTGEAAPPMPNATQAAAIITPSSPTRSTSMSNAAPGHVRQQPGGPPIPPRRRSFGMQIAGPPSAFSAASSSTDGHYVADRTRSTVNVPSNVESDLRDRPTRRRSIVARLSMRKSSKEHQKAASNSLTSR